MRHALRIRTKLLLAIGGINMLWAILVYVLNSQSFDRGFSHYVGQQVLSQHDELALALVQHYQQHGGWQWLQHHPEHLRALLAAYTGRRDARRNPPSNTPLPKQAPPRERNGSGLLVLDAQQRSLVGTGHTPPDLSTRPLALEGKIVGYLAYAPRRDLSRTANRAFQAQQQQMFTMIAIAMLLSSVLMAWGIGQWLNRRLQPLTTGARQLTKGEFHHRIPIDTADELAQLATDFNTLAHSLAANQQSRQQWIIDISHELRTPLTILQGELEALRDGVRPASPTYLHSLWQEIQRLTALVNDLHLLSQADAGSLTYHWQTLDLAEHLEDSLRAVRPQFDQHTLTIDFHPVTAFVRADNHRLRQLWLNLAQNTLRYTDAAGQVRIHMQMQPSHVIVTWEDSSPSVNAADLPRLTERLFRVDSSRHRAHGGSGLGLSIVKAIADAHHVQLVASISPLGGLCWTLTFPLADGVNE